MNASRKLDPAIIEPIECIWIRVDETKIRSPKDLMLLHRIRAAAERTSGAFDHMLGDRDVNWLFNDGALYFDRAGQ